MGYTEYFSQRRSFSDAEWDAILTKAKIIFVWAENHGVKIDDQEGGEPIANDQKIWFNGIGSEAHETFVVTKERGDSFNFCKTAEKPYTIVVQMVLMACYQVSCELGGYEIPRSALDISSDGRWDIEWKEAQIRYGNLFGTKFETSIFS